jgi:hypothetical protein
MIPTLVRFRGATGQGIGGGLVGLARGSLVGIAAVPTIVGTGCGFLSCVVARTFNGLCKDPLPNYFVTRWLRRRWGAGTWPWDRLSYGEFTAYGLGLGTTVGLFWWLIS